MSGGVYSFVFALAVHCSLQYVMMDEACNPERYSSHCGHEEDRKTLGMQCSSQGYTFKGNTLGIPPIALPLKGSIIPYYYYMLGIKLSRHRPLGSTYSNSSRLPNSTVLTHLVFMRLPSTQNKKGWIFSLTKIFCRKVQEDASNLTQQQCYFPGEEGLSRMMSQAALVSQSVADTLGMTKEIAKVHS